MIDNTFATFTNHQTREAVSIRADKIVAYMRWYGLGAKPEDKPVGTLIVLFGGEPKGGILVTESYDEVRAIISNCDQ